MIHRFSKSQQDSLLAAVEKGWITLIEPQPKIPALKLFLPYYPLSSLCIKRHKEDLESLATRFKNRFFLASKNIELRETEALLRLSGGDGRKLLNIFELVINASADSEIIITNERVLS
jgi:putative ATPase